MGSEAIGSVTIRDESGATLAHAHDVKALLESREFILRGPLRRVLRVDQLRDVAAEGDRLRFGHGNERYELILGPSVAARWAKKILTPPPTLAAKLGIAPERPAVVIGRVTDARLVEALLGATTGGEPGTPPDLAIAEIDDAEGLENAVAELPTGLPIWLVHRKGPGTDFGDTAIRQRMRSLGFIDTKVAAVSDARTATRYSPRPTKTEAPAGESPMR
ncbi:hypothetical protein [Herbiconiux ginsengi]|uniref:Uncharacterized protein n=1 Tax=Herbiconiux ginsengi TaxID=381665 RepID=A0A1H3M499_9MICO|nr:hypothetical protein [Herbiconiux ginsengi]SDY71386.1 hypothetical protein SAMN05216554_1262 [Herbiconiux ginsengi]